ncbi:MAG: glycine cleavage system aminomethyltransferase GcvT [Actinobacteria bacterium]|nr:glycine cleavage system aminomethyltransferase GcvT [Actinomycetota bacterium]
MPKKTPLFDEEVRLGAKFTEFAGWELPLYYSGIIDEHISVRSSAGLFDISHLGKISVKGLGSAELLQHLAVIDISKISTGRGAYTIFCNETGGIIDDDIIYRFDEADYFVVTNATRLQALLDWLVKHRSPGTEIEDYTDRLGLLALQGPESPEILRAIFNEDPGLYKRYSVKKIVVNGNKFTVMKSGYTGEEGYEIIAEPKVEKVTWQMLLDAGVKPVGLGARDTLRLEMGYPLYGRDITIETTPLEAGLEWVISFEKGDFIGREVLLRKRDEGVNKRLVGFVLDWGIARGDEQLFIAQGKEIGRVTSGGYSPILKRGIGLAYVLSEYAQVGMDIKIKVRNRELTGRIEERPFINRRRLGYDT